MKALIGAVNQQEAPTGAIVTWGPIGFEEPDYSDDDYIDAHGSPWNVEEVTHADIGGLGVSVEMGSRLRVDTHTDHQPGQVVDMSDHGTQVATHDLSMGKADHKVRIEDAFTDSMIFVHGGYNACFIQLRGSSDNPTTSDWYCVMLKRFSVTLDLTVHLLRASAGELVESISESLDFSASYSTTDPLDFEAQILGSVITASINGVNEFTYDTASDVDKLTAGNFCGWGNARQYTGPHGINSQMFIDNVSATSL